LEFKQLSWLILSEMIHGNAGAVPDPAVLNVVARSGLCEALLLYVDLAAAEHSAVRQWPVTQVRSLLACHRCSSLLFSRQSTLVASLPLLLQHV
jgi:hypothetical protein